MDLAHIPYPSGDASLQKTSELQGLLIALPHNILRGDSTRAAPLHAPAIAESFQTILDAYRHTQRP